MEFIKIKDNCYYFQGAVNIGYILSSDQKNGMLIDAGLEASAAKKVLAFLQKNDLPLNYLFITHAHADHFGGAKYIQDHMAVHTIAPQLEGAIMQNPILEPIYLFNGSRPLKEMRNKFLEAPAIRIDEICEEGPYEITGLSIEYVSLPGHSYNQMGILYQDVLYCADAFFGIEVLNKHKIPFIVDAKSTLHTLHQLLEFKGEGVVPGHGSYTRNFVEEVQANINVHDNNIKHLNEIVSLNKCLPFDTLIAIMLNETNVVPNNLGSFTLFRTALSAYLILLLEEGKVHYKIENGYLMISSGSSLA